MNLKVRLLLQMINNLSRPAKAARDDLRGIKGEADKLKNAGTGDKLAKDIEKVSARARAARRDLLAMGAAARDANGRLRDGKGRFVASAGGGARKGARAAGGGAAAEAAGGGTAVLGGGARLIGGIAAGYAARELVRRTVGKAVDFEKEMADVKKKVDLPDGQNWGDMEKTITDSALNFGRSRAEVARLTAELGAAGIAYGELSQFIALATKAGVAWDMTAAEAGEKLMKVKAGLGYDFKQLVQFVDKVNALSDAGASKERDVVEMQGRSAAAAKESGVHEDIAMSFLTGMNSAGIQPEVASRGFNAMISKLRTAKSNGGDKMKEGLKMLGLTPDAVEKGMRDNALKMLTDIIARFDKAKDKTAAGVKMFGAEWWDEFARMVRAFPEIRRYLDLIASGKWEGSAQKSVNEELKTTANHLERLKVLAESVGDRLGRWALPPINNAIQAIIDKLNALDAQAEEKRRAAEAVKNAEAGKPLTPEQREQAARDQELAREVQRAQARGGAQRDYAATVAGDRNRTGEQADAERQKLKRRNLERQIQFLKSDIANSDPAATLGNEKKRRRLQLLESQRDQLPEGGRIDAAGNPAADQKNEARQWNLKLVNDVLDQTERRVANLVRLAAAMPRDKAIENDLVEAQGSASRARGKAKAANTSEVNPFGYGSGNKAMPGRTNGAPKGMAFDFARSMRERMQPDLQPDGALIMERLRAGMESGKSGVESTAQGTRTAIEAPFKGMNLQSEGQAAMASFAAGIKAGENQAVQAALQAKARVMNALGGGKRAGVSGALHDGVTGQ